MTKDQFADDMPNVISNNCFASHCCDLLGVKTLSPFRWAWLFNDDFIRLIEAFNEIDFSNIKVSLAKHWSKDIMYAAVDVDGQLTSHMVHMVQDGSCSSPTRCRYDVRCSHICSIVEQDWRRRCRRMTDHPHFVYYTPTSIFNDGVAKFADAKTPFKKTVIPTTLKQLDLCWKLQQAGKHFNIVVQHKLLACRKPAQPSQCAELLLGKYQHLDQLKDK